MRWQPALSNMSFLNGTDMSDQFPAVFPHSNMGNLPNFRMSPMTTAISLDDVTEAHRAASCTQAVLNCTYTKRTPLRLHNSRRSCHLSGRAMALTSVARNDPIKEL